MIKMGLIGAGTMGDLYARAFTQCPDASVAGVFSRTEDRASTVARRYGIDRVYTSYAQMLAECPMDAVAISTPDYAHREPVIASLEAGKHVLCEKPMARTAQDCLAMISAVDGSGKKLMINCGNRHRPSSFKLREQVESGQLGPVEYVYMRLNEKRTKTMELAWAGRTNPIWNLLSHVVDYVAWIVGQGIVEVYGLAHEGYLKRAKGLDVPDMTVFLVRLESGAFATLESSWVLPDAYPRVVDIRLDVIGECGMIQMDFYEQGFRTYFDKAEEHALDFPVPDFTTQLTGWWFDSCYYFVSCLETGQYPVPDGRDGLAVVETLVAMEESVKRGTVVRVRHVEVPAASAT